MMNIEINDRNKGTVYGFWIRPVSRLRGTSLSLQSKCGQHNIIYFIWNVTLRFQPCLLSCKKLTDSAEFLALSGRASLRITLHLNTINSCIFYFQECTVWVHGIFLKSINQNKLVWVSNTLNACLLSDKVS